MKKNINNIISEEIHKYFLNVIKEEEGGQNGGENNWGAIQQQKSKEYNEKFGHKTDDSEFSEAYSFLLAPTTNLSAVADQLVDAGVLNCKKGPSAQSYLRKMAKELSAPSGGNYELHKNMVNSILKIKASLVK